jgi:hypothetical protein
MMSNIAQNAAADVNLKRIRGRGSCLPYPFSKNLCNFGMHPDGTALPNKSCNEATKLNCTLMLVLIA